MKVGLSSEKLFMDDSEILPFVKIQSTIIFKEGGQVRKYFYKKHFFVVLIFIYINNFIYFCISFIIFIAFNLQHFQSNFRFLIL